MNLASAKNRYLLYFLATILVEGVLVFISFFAEVPFIFEKAIMLPISLFWYYQITKESGLFRTMYGRLMYLAVAVLIIGALAKLEYWWWASYPLLIGLISLGGLYLIRFIKKPTHKLLDWVKLLFLGFALFISLAKLEHFSVEIYELIQLVLFYLMIYLFAYEMSRDSEEKRELFSFEMNED